MGTDRFIPVEEVERMTPSQRHRAFVERIVWDLDGLDGDLAEFVRRSQLRARQRMEQRRTNQVE